MQTDLLSDTVSSRQSEKISDYVLNNINSIRNKPRCIDEMNCRSVPDKRGVDTESKLRGLGQVLNRLPEMNPETKIEEKQTINESVIDRNDIYWNNFNQSTKIQKSCDILSGVTIERFDYLHHDLQTPYTKPKMIPKDTRLMFKDAN